MKPTLNQIYEKFDGLQSICHDGFMEKHGKDYSIEEIIKFRDIPKTDKQKYGAPWSSNARKTLDKYIADRRKELMEMWREE